MEKKWLRDILLVGTVLTFHLLHAWIGLNSILPDYSREFRSSDMHMLWTWSGNILEEGPLNPSVAFPHPELLTPELRTYYDYLGGVESFRQSPLYAYFLAALRGVSQDNLAFIHTVHVLLGFALCVQIGWITWLCFHSHAMSRVAFLIAGLFAPFYAYNFYLLRDILGLNIVLLALGVLIIWGRKITCHGRKRLWWSVGLGLCLGVGYLSREQFLLIFLLLGPYIGWKIWENRAWSSALLLLLAMALPLIPLVARNLAVGVPAFSASNRFPETFTHYNSPTSIPGAFVIAEEMGDYVVRAEGRSAATVRETLAAWEGRWGDFSIFQLRKALSLLQIKESPDNVNYGFVSTIFPMVRFGIPTWVILIPGLAGLILGICRRDTRLLELGIFVASTLVILAVFTPTSRYRLGLSPFLIVSAVYFGQYVWTLWQTNDRKKHALILLLAVTGGWAFSHAIEPPLPDIAYNRPVEYFIALRIYREQGDQEGVDATTQEILKLRVLQEMSSSDGER